MIHPILRLAASQPQLIGDHVEAYAELIGSEVKRTGAAWTRRAVLFAASAMLLLLGLVFAGVALMLWAALPPSGYQAPWVLLAVPGVVLVGAVACFFVAKGSPVESAFDTVKKQIDADMAVLREVGAAA